MNSVMTVDLNNLAWVIRHSLIKDKPKSRMHKKPRTMEAIASAMLKNILNTCIKTGQPRLIIAADAGGCWRYDLYPAYKMKDKDNPDLYKPDVIRAVDFVVAFFRQYTGALVLQVKRTEADDCIGVIVNEYLSDNIDRMTIYSTDTDYKQLCDDRVKLYSHTQGFYDVEDSAWELFFKCVRGDKSDNILTAYPRIQEKRLKKIYTDPVEEANFLNEPYKLALEGDTRQTVQDVMAFNFQLISLRDQPEWVKDAIRKEIDEFTPGKFLSTDAADYVAKTLYEEQAKFKSLFFNASASLKHPPKLSRT